MSHEVLKTVNPFFQLVWEGKKTAEIRKLDRNFYIGQTVLLVEYRPLADGEKCGMRCILIRITDITKHEDFPQGLKSNYGMLSFRVVNKTDEKGFLVNE